MTPHERRATFIYGVLMTAKHTLEHAASMARRDKDEEAMEGARFLNEAVDAAEKAAGVFEGIVSRATVWPEGE